MDRNKISEAYKQLQDLICEGLERVDGVARFQEDVWVRDEGGGGRTRVISNGDLIEKGGVNFSEVSGLVSDEMRKNTGITAESFFATGVSIVLHPYNPHVPIIHMNVRYFELSDGEFWFGGGIDLTPHYVDSAKARLFHEDLKSICDKFDHSFYPKFKNWADDYFYLQHRNETRGIGGIFFDHLKPKGDFTKADLFNFTFDLGAAFVSIYEKQVSDKRILPSTHDQREWQNLRRGRYVEFNLVHDRGTKFGLVSGGRTESILMSMPPNATWEYNKIISEDSEEIKTLQFLKKGLDWLK